MGCDVEDMFSKVAMCVQLCNRLEIVVVRWDEEDGKKIKIATENNFFYAKINGL